MALSLSSLSCISPCLGAPLSHDPHHIEALFALLRVRMRGLAWSLLGHLAFWHLAFLAWLAWLAVTLVKFSAACIAVDETSWCPDNS